MFPRRKADGGEVSEWDAIPRSPEGRPQITVTKPNPFTEGIVPYVGGMVTPYVDRAIDWFKQPYPIKPDTPPPQDLQQEPSQAIGEGVRGLGSGYLQSLKDMASPFVKEEDQSAYREQEIAPSASRDGKIPANQKDIVSAGAPIAAEVMGTFGGVPGTGAGWAALKAAGYGVNAAAIAFGLKASQQAFKKAPQTVGNVAAKLAAEQGYLDTTNFTKVGHQLGYMPGGVYKDPSGTPYYLKFGTDIEQVKNENLAAKLYKLAGTPAAEVSVTHIGGKPGIASKLLPNSHQLSEAKIPYNQIEGLHDNFVVDAWLANHDAVGTGGENPLGNIMIMDGKAVRIDGGGALRYKGSGQIKNHFNDEADEIFSMRDPQFSKRSAQVFGEISDEALRAGAQKVADVDIKKLSELIARYGPTDENEQLALLGKLLKRRQYIMDHFGVKPKNAAQPVDLPPQVSAGSRSAANPNEPLSEAEWAQLESEANNLPPEPGIQWGFEPANSDNYAHLLETVPSESYYISKDLDYKSVFGKGAFGKKIISDLESGKPLSKITMGIAVNNLLSGPSINKEWNAAYQLWDMAENMHPQTAEAIFRNLPPKIQIDVGRRISALAENLDSPFDKVVKGSGGPGKGSPYNFFVSKTKDFKVPSHWNEDHAHEIEDIAAILKQKKSAKAAPPAEEIAEEASAVTPAKLYTTISQNFFKADPKGAAKAIAKESGNDPDKIAEAMYQFAAHDSPEFIDNVYQGLPAELYADVNAGLQKLIDSKGDPWSKSFKKKPIAHQKKVADALKLVDWQNYVPGEKNFERPNLPSEQLKRAREAGSNTNLLLWKSHGKDPQWNSGYVSHGPAGYIYPEEIVKKFDDKGHEPANFLTHDKEIAFGAAYGGKGSPYLAKAKKVFEVDYEDLFGTKDYFAIADGVHSIITAAREKGADMVLIHNITDWGKGTWDHKVQTQYAVLNQSILRAPDAQFDPKKLHLAYPLLGIAGGGLMIYGDLERKDKMNRGGIPGLVYRAKALARGGPGSAPWTVRNRSHPRHKAGMIKSSIPGRTDKIPMSVPPGSYILPADVPSALGEGNTMAGEKILGAMFKSGPYSQGARSFIGKKAGRFADGGTPEQTENEDIPIIAAGGEYVIHPEQVAAIGNGDMKAGHKVLDKFVLSVRKKNIDTLKKLKPPKK